MTKIEWTNATWNPVVGCSVISPGCTNCYAMKMAARLEAISVAHERDNGGDPGPMVHYRGTTEQTRGGAVWSGKIAVVEHAIAPFRWRKPRMVFVNSMSDLFHDGIPDEVIDRIFAVMALSPQHTFQVLTKRPERMHRYMTAHTGSVHDTGHACGRVADVIEANLTKWGVKRTGVGPLPHLEAGSPWWPLPNVWLGVSTEDQRRADERIPLLLDTPAAVRWISAEPLLGPLSIADHLVAHDGSPCPVSDPECLADEGENHDACEPRTRIDWVVTGGESGPNARPAHPDWFRSIRDQCSAAGVPFFFKQWGDWLASPDDLNFDEGMAWAKGLGCRGKRVQQHSDGHTYARVGKKRAGKMLDGREHLEYPRAAA